MSSGRIPSIEGGIQPTIFDAKADILTATAADTPARLAVGANDTVLTADSSTATGLKWATVSAGGMTQIATGSMSGSSVTISSIPTTYKHLQLIIRGIYNTSDNLNVRMRVNGDTSSVYGVTTSNGVGASLTLLADQYDLYINTYLNTTNTNAVIDFLDYANTTTYKNILTHQIHQDATSSWTIRSLRGSWRNTAAITSITILDLGTTFTAGTYILYGVS